MAIDTLGYVKALESAGVERDVAEAHLKAMRDAVFPELVTKTDLADTEQRLDAKIDRLEVRMRATIWQSSLAMMLGGLTIGGFLIRFLK